MNKKNIILIVILHCFSMIAMQPELTHQQKVDSIFLNACKNDKSIQFALSQGANINAVDPQTGKTGLFFFCERGNVPVVKDLLDRGADVNINCNRKFYSCTPLHVSLDYPKILELLLQKKADFYREGELGNAFEYACMIHKLDAMKFFLKKGFDINVTGPFSHTILHGAASDGDPAVVTFLAQNGANPTWQSQLGLKPRNCAEQRGHKGVALYLKRLETFYNEHKKELAKAVVNKDYFAQILKKIPVCDAPIPFGFIFPANQCYINKQLLESCQYNTMSIEDMEYCIDLGADVHHKDLVSGYNVLHYAAKAGNIKFIKLLAAKGADLQAKTDDGRTIIDLAPKKKRPFVRNVIAASTNKLQQSEVNVNSKIIMSESSIEQTHLPVTHTEKVVMPSDVEGLSDKIVISKKTPNKKHKKEKKSISLRKTRELSDNAGSTISSEQMISSSDIVCIVDKKTTELDDQKKNLKSPLILPACETETSDECATLPIEKKQQKKEKMYEGIVEAVKIKIMPKILKKDKEQHKSETDNKQEQRISVIQNEREIKINTDFVQKNINDSLAQYNPLLNLQFSNHVERKRQQTNDYFHNFTTDVEKKCGDRAYCVKHKNKKKYLIPGMMELPSGVIKEGNFSYIVKKTSEQNAICTHRFFEEYKQKNHTKNNEKKLTFSSPDSDNKPANNK